MLTSGPVLSGPSCRVPRPGLGVCEYGFIGKVRAELPGPARWLSHSARAGSLESALRQIACKGFATSGLICCGGLGDSRQTFQSSSLVLLAWNGG